MLRCLVLLLLWLSAVMADFNYPDFNDTMGLVFVGSAATTDCHVPPLTQNRYGDYEGKADLFNENVVAEVSESTDSTTNSSVETNVDTFNFQISLNQSGFLHIANTKSAPTSCLGRARLTPSGPSKAGAMWYRSEAPVSNGFDTHFMFQITDHSKECTVHKDQYFSQFSYRSCSVHGGDGFAFVLQYTDRQHLNGTYEVGQNGGQLGFGGIPNSLAIAFDTWQNPGHDLLGVDNIKIQSRGQLPNDGLEAGLLGVPRAATLADGNIHTARIVYFPTLMSKYLNKLSASPELVPYLKDNGEQKRVGTLVVWIDDGIASDEPILAMPINLSLVINMPSDKAYVGFTSSTGRFYEKHDILAWTWCDQYPCSPPDPQIFDRHTVSKFYPVNYQSFTPGPGYGGAVGATSFPIVNENPPTDPWTVPVEHFSLNRTTGLYQYAALQTPPATLY